MRDIDFLKFPSAIRDVQVDFHLDYQQICRIARLMKPEIQDSTRLHHAR